MSVLLMFQAQEQLQADVLRYKAKIEDLEKEVTLKGQVGHTNARMNQGRLMYLYMLYMLYLNFKSPIYISLREKYTTF